MTLSAFWFPDPHSPAPRRALLTFLFAAMVAWFGLARHLGVL